MCADAGHRREDLRGCRGGPELTVGGEDAVDVYFIVREDGGGGTRADLPRIDRKRKKKGSK